MGISVDIVLVDDDPDEHLLFHEDLKDARVLFEFSAFTKADLALEHLQERGNTPVLLLTDLSLADDAALRLIEACQPYLMAVLSAFIPGRAIRTWKPVVATLERCSTLSNP